MPWPKDEAKLNRVRSLMRDQDLSALVVRAPDNIVYLTNYWCMKGYDAVVFPRDGEPTLIAIEPQLADAQRNSWAKDIRLFKSYDERDPRPPQYRALDIALEVLRAQHLTEKIAIELNMGTQSADRMVGEPTTPTQNYFDAFRKLTGQVVDATPLLNEARAIKTSQEIERMRLANELAALAMEHTRENMRVGMKESEVGGMYEAFVHGLGVGYKGKVEMARAFTLVSGCVNFRRFNELRAGAQPHVRRLNIMAFEKTSTIERYRAHATDKPSSALLTVLTCSSTISSRSRFGSVSMSNQEPIERNAGAVIWSK